MAEKFEKKGKRDEFSVQDKIKSIKESKMPEKQKEDLLKEMGLITEESPKGIPFNVFAQIKKIPSTMRKAMQLYPKAKNVSLASLEEWESIFKDF